MSSLIRASPASTRRQRVSTPPAFCVAASPRLGSGMIMPTYGLLQKAYPSGTRMPQIGPDNIRRRLGTDPCWTDGRPLNLDI